MPSDAFIIKLLRQGKDEAYRFIFDRHYNVLCQFAEHFLHDRFQSEAIVGDVIFHIWEIRETLDKNLNLRSYLISAVRNSCINYLKTKHRRTEIPFSHFFISDENEVYEPDILQTTDDEHPLGILLEQELEREINEAVERLPEECKRVFKKSRFENKTYAEISCEIGISVNTVKYHIKNALSFLLVELRQYLTVIFVFLTLSDYPHVC